MPTNEIRQKNRLLASAFLFLAKIIPIFLILIYIDFLEILDRKNRSVKNFDMLDFLTDRGKTYEEEERFKSKKGPHFCRPLILFLSGSSA